MKKQFFWNKNKSKKMEFVEKQIIDIKKYGGIELLRKIFLLVKKLMNIPINILALIPVAIIRIISPFLVIRIQRAPAPQFGDFIEQLGIYYCKKKLKINLLPYKHLDLFYIYHKHKLYNKFLEKMWKRNIIFLSSYILEPIDKVNKLIPGWKKHVVDLSERRDINNLYHKYQALKFTNTEEIDGKKMLKKFSLNNKDKFVCLAVRDGAYQQKKIKDRDWSYHDFRHTDIDKFILAAEELTKLGYYVFRMGVVVEKPLNSNNPKIIDYANSKLRSDFMDIYLGANCSFCITTCHGFHSLPLIFGKPLVNISSPIGSLNLYNEKHFNLTKHHILIKEKRELSLSEIFSHGVSHVFDTKIFKQKGVELIENTPEEIRDIILEMAENIEHKKELSQEDEELQKTFKNIYNSHAKKFQPDYSPYYAKEIQPDYAKKIQPDYSPYYHLPFKGRFSSKFLRENKNWLK